MTASARNWAAMWRPGRAEGAAQADLGAALEDGDHHDVGDADAADQQRDRAEAEEQGGGRGWRPRAARSARPRAG